MQSYKQLRVWQRAHALTLAVYRLATSFPADERFALCSQLRRAAVSVPTNIVEGSKRQTNADYARFLNIAEASLAETEYLLLLALDLGYLSNEAHQPIAAEIDEVARMLHALRTKVEQGDP
jgi:four helix bundle protein